MTDELLRIADDRLEPSFLLRMDLQWFAAEDEGRTEDPTEQKNLMKDPAYLDRYLKMDVQLTQEIMRSLTASHKDKGLDFGNVLWSSEAFGKEGWQRTYPNPM